MIIDIYGNKRWYYNEDNLYMMNGWYIQGKLHRVDGPAVERANGDKEWYINGVHHRIDGPAVEYADGSVEYWENGIQRFPRFRSIDSKFEVSCG